MPRRCCATSWTSWTIWEVSIERVWVESERALAEQDPGIYFEVLRDCHALEQWLPELVITSGINRLKHSAPHTHSAPCRWASLLSELPASRAIDCSNRIKAQPLEKEKWAAVIDTVGSSTLATTIAQTRREGIVTACGLAGGMDLPSSVAPFILRGVTLRGIDSVMASLERRELAWERLSSILNRDHLETLSTTVPMSELLTMAPAILAGEIRGRVVVDVNR